MRLIDADNLDETITRLNEQDWGITRNEYKLIDRVIFEMPTVNVPSEDMVLKEMRAEINHLLNRPSLTHVVGYDKGFVDGIDKVLQIIDRHIAE